MRVLIMEDEARIAARILRMITDLLGGRLVRADVCESVEEGKRYLQTHAIDLLFLDLNLNGHDGFELLRTFSAEAFHTVVISAHRERAIHAFEYGVLDFIPKPFDNERVAAALARVTAKRQENTIPLKFLSVKQKSGVRLIGVDDVLYFRGAGIYTEICLPGGEVLLHNKSLDRLGQLLDGAFERIHKSYLVPVKQFDRLGVDGRPFLWLKCGEKLPVGRTRYEGLKRNWI